MRKLFLFDLDKTLALGVSGHRESFSIAFREVYGIEASVYEIDFRGMTDRQIIYGVLQKHGLSEEEIDAKITQCFETMVAYYRKIIHKESIVALPGAKELLEFLKGRDEVLLGIATGNTEEIAKMKLEKAGLADYFAFGSFGDKASVREQLIANAIAEARKIGFKGETSDVFVFGDTPRDVKAAKANDAKAVGIANGNYTMQELSDAGADFVFENLIACRKWLEKL